MTDTMTLGELHKVLTTLIETGHNPDLPLFAGDPDEPETVDGLTQYSGRWMIDTSPYVEDDPHSGEIDISHELAESEGTK